MAEQNSQQNGTEQSNRPSARRPQQRRNEFVQTRKSVPYTLQVQSNAMLDYMSRNGGAAAGAFQRVAGLIQFTANDTVVRERLDTWFESVIANASERANALSVQQEKYSEGIVTNVPRPKVPENYKYVVEITHPIFWKLIGLVEMIDNVMGEIEFLWLSGQLEDVHLQNAQGQAINTIRTMVNRIYYVTNASRNRKGGLYNPDAYNELMQALIKNEEAPEHQENETGEQEAAATAA
ncbi:hypothetical protein R7D97_17125 [Vibrio sp. Vb5031]|uniref:Uncharacterized protein n=3 Tax=Vibrio TaxID=662 RepID=A0A0M0HXN4_9VIBR|nr:MULTISPECIES: hypothetical protein [Vibrio]KOO06830.1 hypothetical protein AKJ31_14035 [Vibrio hepatarius]MCR9821724.1 hypothetical protein [Vibrio parahaemolyticus]MDW1505909.1 hypothetical protein [Vibrio sp. Vb5031]MDW1517074.1 hypothetical protein [Vibrio sp. Vb5035]MDW1547288.1 hypothetical protein [Vibrio sp. Vb5034]